LDNLYCSSVELRDSGFITLINGHNGIWETVLLLTRNSSLFQPRQRILRGTDEEFIFPLVKKRGAII